MQIYIFISNGQLKKKKKKLFLSIYISVIMELLEIIRIRRKRFIHHAERLCFLRFAIETFFTCRPFGALWLWLIFPDRRFTPPAVICRPFGAVLRSVRSL